MQMRKKMEEQNNLDPSTAKRIGNEYISAAKDKQIKYLTTASTFQPILLCNLHAAEMFLKCSRKAANLHPQVVSNT